MAPTVADIPCTRDIILRTTSVDRPKNTVAPTKLQPLLRPLVKPRPISKLWSEVAQRLLACGILVAITPVMCIAYILVRCTSKGPFLYSQLRPGLNGRAFRIWKVRTMAVNSDACTKLARRVDARDPRVTFVGRILRKSKLDEFPQLWNIVRGEMAFVGPRPIAITLHEELCNEIPGFENRTLVRPGLSNIGQVSIEDNAGEEHLVDDWRERFESELHYIQNRSVEYDLIVMVMTAIFLVLKFTPRFGK